MALFQGSTGKPVPECQRSGFYWSKDDAGGDNNWSYKTNHQQTSSQLSTGQMPYSSPNQLRQCTAGKSITFHGLGPSQLT